MLQWPWDFQEISLISIRTLDFELNSISFCKFRAGFDYCIDFSSKLLGRLRAPIPRRSITYREKPLLCKFCSLLFVLLAFVPRLHFWYFFVLVDSVSVCLFRWVSFVHVLLAFDLVSCLGWAIHLAPFRFVLSRSAALKILSSASFWRGNQVDGLPRRHTWLWR